MISTSLFEGANIRFAAIDPVEDSKIETSWTMDLDYAQDLMNMPARPLGALELRKIHEENQKKAEERGSQFFFAIRLKEGNQLAGFIRLPWVFWTHSSAWLKLAIADPSIIERFGREALDLALAYCFQELNLYRVETAFPEYQKEMISLFEGAGFLMEVRRRQVHYRNGRYYDALHYGLLQSEWKSGSAEGGAA